MLDAEYVRIWLDMAQVLITRHRHISDGGRARPFLDYLKTFLDGKMGKSEERFLTMMITGKLCFVENFLLPSVFFPVNITSPLRSKEWC